MQYSEPSKAKMVLSKAKTSESTSSRKMSDDETLAELYSVITWRQGGHIGARGQRPCLKKSDSFSNKVDDCTHNRRSISRKPILH